MNADHWEQGRQFIKALIDVCKADVNATVQKQQKTAADKYAQRAERYVYGGGNCGFARRQKKHHQEAKTEEEYFEGFGKCHRLLMDYFFWKYNGYFLLC